MSEKKSIVEEAMLDVKHITNALTKNTKEILRSVAKEEIDSIVKESLLKEDDYEEEDLEPNTDLDASIEASDEEGEESTEDNLDNLEPSNEVEPEMEPELSMDTDVLGGEEIDMTNASDDDVLAIFKKLKGDDEIEIVGDEIHLDITEPGEYIIKTNELPIGGEEKSIETNDELEIPSDDETEYEIEMGGEDDETPIDDLVAVEDEDETEDEEIKESIPVGLAQSKRVPGKSDIGQPKGAGAKTLEESEILSETKRKYNLLLTESNKLKKENVEFREALKVFKNQLIETVVFNSNLTYTTKLFMEHSTTKIEKENIIKRFDEEVTNLNESKKLYKTIANELGNRKPINETIVNKLTKDLTTSSSVQLNESTAYVDPSTTRIKDLINRVENKHSF